IDFVECHGTGTSLGDPIEVQALAAVYGSQRPSTQPLLLGALKTNIGHLESAAGLAGVAKLLAAFLHRQLPPSIHTRPANPLLDWEQLPVSVVETLTPWGPRPERPRRAGVSAFGLSGTNAHAILEEAPPPSATPLPRRQPTPALPFILSARNDAALSELAQRLRQQLLHSPPASLADLADALLHSREQFPRRLCLVADSVDALTHTLANTNDASVSAFTNPRVAVMFTGQGAQRVAMGRELAVANPAFARALDDIAAHFAPLLEHPLRDVIFAEPGSSLIDQTAYTQPALFAIELALYGALQSIGLQPDFLLGHSIGELVAAHVAGVFSLSDACKLVAARGRLMQELPAGGTMLSVQAGEADTLAALAEHPLLDIAALNGPLSTVVSGPADAIAALQRQLESSGLKTRRLVVSHAFHSRLMEPMLE
ncbi:MAG: type I polyketide synthase, partial [Myxococcales bacterium]|nr:type I polyketide synthase [Myxococcales bacterium]